MRECEKYQNQLADYIRKILSPEEEKELARHLADCPDCQSEYREMEAVLEVLKEEKELELPPAFWGELAGSTGTKIDKKKERIPRFKPAWVLAPAAAITALFLAINLFQVDKGYLTKKESLPEGALVWFESEATQTTFDQEINQTLAKMSQEIEKVYWEDEEIETLLAELSETEFQTLEEQVKKEKF